MRGDDNQQEGMFSYISRRSGYQRIIRYDRSARWWTRF
jgi:hypothetical protein